MKSRWVSALIKTIIFLVIVHIIFLVLGYFLPMDRGIFNLPMVWAHWSDNWMDCIWGIVGLVATYVIIYYMFTNDPEEEIEDHH